MSFPIIGFAIRGNDSCFEPQIPKEVVYATGRIEMQVYLPWRAPWSVGKVEEVLNVLDFIMTKAKTKAAIAVRKAVVPTAIDMNRSRRVTSVFDCQVYIGWDCSRSLISSLSPNVPNQPVFSAVTVAELSLISALLPFLISSISTKKTSFHPPPA